MEFVGHIVLSPSLPCDYSCLNKKIKIIIAGYEGHLYTPVLKKELEKGTLPRLSEPFPQSTISFNNNVNWGCIKDSNNNSSTVETLKFVYNISDENFLKDPDIFLEETDLWLKRFKENLFPLFWILYLGTIRVDGEKKHDFTYYYKNNIAKSQNLYKKNSLTNIKVNVERKKNIELELFKKIIILSKKD